MCGGSFVVGWAGRAEPTESNDTRYQEAEERI